MICTIQTPTPNLEESRSYYERLGFDIHNQEGVDFATCGKIVVEINAARTARAGVKFYNSDLAALARTLPNHIRKAEHEGNMVLQAPSGCWIYLVNGDPAITLTHEVEKDSLCGKYAGISLETINLQDSMAFWEHFGFKQTGGDATHGWVAMQHENGFGISLMSLFVCPHLFYNPSLTFFNSGGNLPIIEKIRAQHIPITEEITLFNKEGIVDNIIIRDPGGLGFFIFND